MFCEIGGWLDVFFWNGDGGIGKVFSVGNFIGIVVVRDVVEDFFGGVFKEVDRSLSGLRCYSSLFNINVVCDGREEERGLGSIWNLIFCNVVILRLV